MGFLPVLGDDELSDDAIEARNRFRDEHPGPLRDLDRALLGSVPVFEAYAGWFTVRDELEPLVGERAVDLFSLAICEGARSPYCVAWFRKEIVEAGDDPDAPQVTEAERLLIDWGRAIGRSPADVDPDLVERVEATFSASTRVVLAGYAGLMLAVAAFASIGQLAPGR